MASVTAPALEDCLDRYWMLGADEADVTFSIAQPRVPLALLKRLGIPDFEGINPRSFQRQVEAVYDAVTEAAIRIAFQDSQD
jgi:uncharacterized Zn finger protein